MAQKAVKSAKNDNRKKNEGLALGGTILVVLGLLFLAKQLFNADLLDKVWPYAWPVALILCGAAILMRLYRR